MYIAIQNTTYVFQHSDEISITSGLHVSAVKQPSSGQCRTYTYLLTPWCRVLLEKLTGLQLVKKFPAFHGTQRFITALTNIRHLSLSWTSPIQSVYSHPTSWRSILILSTHLRLGLPRGLLPSGFPSKTLYTPLSSPIRATYTSYKISVHSHRLHAYIEACIRVCSTLAWWWLFYSRNR